MIDDVQFIAGKESTQEEFFHTMNEIIGAGKRLVITADRSPQDLEGIESRILSRLGGGLVADVNPADFELRYNIIRKKLEAMPQAQVPEEVALYLARHVATNVRELEGALNRVVAYAMLSGRAIDIDFVGETLADVLRANQRRITIDEIQRRVAEHYRIRQAEMTSARRAREVARPRQVAMYLAKQLTPRSLPEIGRRFGGRDHYDGDPRRPPDRESCGATDAELDAGYPTADAPARGLRGRVKNAPRRSCRARVFRALANCRLGGGGRVTRTVLPDIRLLMRQLEG